MELEFLIPNWGNRPHIQPRVVEALLCSGAIRGHGLKHPREEIVSFVRQESSTILINVDKGVLFAIILKHLLSMLPGVQKSAWKHIEKDATDAKNVGGECSLLPIEHGRINVAWGSALIS